MGGWTVETNVSCAMIFGAGGYRWQEENRKPASDAGIFACSIDSGAPLIDGAGGWTGIPWDSRRQRGADPLR